MNTPLLIGFLSGCMGAGLLLGAGIGKVVKEHDPSLIGLALVLFGVVWILRVIAEGVH